MCGRGCRPPETSDAASNIRGVIDETRAERTTRLLVSRLDTLAKVASTLHHAEATRLVELASVATMHAIALETLHVERAEEIWRQAHERHPQLPEVVLAPPQRLVA